MSLESKIYKNELGSEINELSLRRRNIEKYLCVKYKLDSQNLLEMTNILEKSKINDAKLQSGMYDSVIESLIQQTFPKKSTFSEAEIIKKQEKDEGIQTESYNNPKNNQSEQNSAPLTEEQLEQLRILAQKRKESEEARNRLRERRNSR